MNQTKKIKVLFVCLGNICRSPTADAVFRKQVKSAGLEQEIMVDSAGTHSFHIGKQPDMRTQDAARERGYKMHELRARAVDHDDFDAFDYILAMDNDNLDILQERCPPHNQHKLALFMQYSNTLMGDEVSDPYYGGKKGFENVLDKVEAAGEGLLEHIRQSNI